MSNEAAPYTPSSSSEEQQNPKSEAKTEVPEGSFTNELFEQFSFTHCDIVSREPEWLKVRPVG